MRCDRRGLPRGVVVDSRGNAYPPLSTRGAPGRPLRPPPEAFHDDSPLVQAYVDMVATSAPARPSYERLDQIASCGMVFRRGFLQLYWDSVLSFEAAVEAVRMLMVAEDVPVPGPDGIPAPGRWTERLASRTESLFSVYSKASVEAYLGRVHGWLGDRDRALEAAARAVCDLSVDAVAVVLEARRPLRAMLGMFAAEDERDRPVRFRDEFGDKLGGWTR